MNLLNADQLQRDVQSYVRIQVQVSGQENFEAESNTSEDLQADHRAEGK